MITFRAYGEPRPKGSKRGFVVNTGRGPRAVVADDNKKSKPWQQEIAQLALAETGEDLIDGPVHVALRFYLTKPKSVKRAHPSVKPDVDKLSRVVLDALAGTVFRDDALVVSLAATKQYATNAEPPGVRVIVSREGA